MGQERQTLGERERNPDKGYGGSGSDIVKGWNVYTIMKKRGAGTKDQKERTGGKIGRRKGKDNDWPTRGAHHCYRFEGYRGIREGKACGLNGTEQREEEGAKERKRGGESCSKTRQNPVLVRATGGKK